MNAFQAEAIARHAHLGQKYKDLPYVEGHIIPVVDRVISAGGSPEAVVVAWLHDVLEDNPQAARAWQDSPHLILTRAQAIALNAITRREGEDYDVYVLRAASDPIARLVKYCDLLVNLSNSPPAHLRLRYLRALEVVRMAVDLNGQIPTRGMVRLSMAASAEIDAYFARAGDWMKREQRAAAVLDWCDLNGWPVDGNLTPERLAIAMSAMPYWSQGPSNFFDMSRALNAVLLLP